METRLQAFQRGGVTLSPIIKKCIHAVDEYDELRMLINGRLDGLLSHCQIEVARAVILEKRTTELWADVPVTMQRVYIRDGNSASQVAFDVLNVLGLSAVDVTGDVEIEIILLDLLKGNHAGVF